MFEDKKITVEKVKDLIYRVQNEMDDNFVYEVRELNDSDFELMSYYLNCFVEKLGLVINDELCD